MPAATKKKVVVTKKVVTKKVTPKEVPKKSVPSKKVEQFIGKKIGANIIVNLGSQRFSRKVSKEDYTIIINKINLFNKRPGDTLKKQIIKLLEPITSKLTEEKEVTEIKLKGYKQLEKKEAKTKAKLNPLGEFKKIISESKADGKEFIAYSKDNVVMKGFENIIMPDLLVNKIKEFLIASLSLKPLLNFWSQCLLNPNEVARTRLFQYLSRHKFIITPSGYFVTYRMVKKTNDPNVFTDAHTGSMKYKIGELATIPRSECDEDGSRDCSKGLHVGSPDFIGIEKGDGYNRTTGQVGTGYVRQTYQGFGDQPIVAFVNPRHVVSIPNSETRKLRCCEFYPFKLTTPEEVMSIEDSSYLVYENDYKKIELKQLLDSIKKENLKEYLEATSVTSKNIKETISRLEKELADNKLQLGGDTISSNIDLLEVKNLVNSRLKVLKQKSSTTVKL